MKIQLNKYLAHAGIASRRKAEELILNGDITVNGKLVIDSGYRVTENDVVKYKNRVVYPEEKIYILLNKPKGYITTTSDEKKRKTVMDLIDSYNHLRLYPIGRLDRGTTGVLLITNDGDLAQVLSHPRNNISKVYKATLDKKLKSSDALSIKQGITLEDGFIKADHLWVEDNPKQIGIEIHSGKNRIVRRIFEHLGYKLIKLDRSSYAGLTRKNLQSGQWRLLRQEEVKKLFPSFTKKTK